MSKTFEQEWAEIEQDPKWASLPADRKRSLARTFAQNIARQEVPGNHPRMRAFLEKNVVGTTTRPDTKGAFMEGAREGFDASALGIIGNAAARKAGLSNKPAGPGTGASVMDAASNLFMPGGGNSLLGEGAMRGATAATGAMLAQVPDLAAGGFAAKGLTAGAARLGLGQTASQVAGGVVSNAAIAGTATKAAGGTNSDAAKAAGLAGAMGLLPLAGKVPAGKYNPNIIPPAKPTLKTKPGAPILTKMDLGKPGPRPATVDATYPGVPALAAPDGLTQPMPHDGKFYAPTGIAPVANGEIRVPPGGFTPSPAMVSQVGQRPPGRPPQAPPAPLMLPPGVPGRINGETIPMPPALEAARVAQVGQRPPSLTPAEAMALARALEAKGVTMPAIPAPSRPGLPPDQAQALLGAAFTDEASTMALLQAALGRRPGGQARRIVNEFQRENVPPLVEREAVVPKGEGPASKPGPVRFPSGLRIAEVKSRDFKPTADMTDAQVLAEWNAWESGRGMNHPHYAYRGDELEMALRGRGFHYFTGEIEGTPTGWAKQDAAYGLADASTDDLVAMLPGLRRTMAGKKGRATRVQNLVDRDANSMKRNRYQDNSSGAKAAQEAEELAERIAAIEAELGRRKGTGGSSTFQRLAMDEDGTFDPKALMDALDNAIGFTGETARRFYGSAKGGVQRAAGIVGPYAQTAGTVTTMPGRLATQLGEAVGVGALGRMAETGRRAMMYEPANTGKPILDKALNLPRRVMFSEYNKTPEMLEAYRLSKVDAANLARPTRELGLDIDKKLTGAQQFDVHMQAAEPTYKGAMSPEALDVQADSRRVTAEMQRIGALDPVGAARWDGHYLPREYTKHLLKPKGAPANFTRGGDKDLSGYHGRGIDATIEPAELPAALAAGWQQVGKPMKNGKVRIWRDYTIAERQGWGEVRHAGRAMNKKAAMVEAEARAAYFLDRLAKPGAGDARGKFAEPAAQYKQKGMDLPPEQVINGQRYILLDGTKKKGGPIKKWGNLADHYVREDVYEFLTDVLTIRPFIEQFHKYTLNNAWKKMVTIMNVPGYFLNNALHNNPMLRVHGGSTLDLPEAAAMLARNDALVQQMTQGGWLHNDATARELGARVLHLTQNNASGYYHSGFSMAKTLARAVDGWRAFENEAYNVAGATDDMYRVALVHRLTKPAAEGGEGKSFDEAVRIAERAFYNPEAVTAPAAQVATLAAPFARVMWYTTDALSHAATTNPVRAAMLTTTAAVTPYVLNKMMGKSDEQHEAEQASLHPHMKGIGNSIPVGYNAEGLPIYLDTSTGNPGGAYNLAENYGVPVIKGLTLGGTPAIVAQLAAGKDLFTGKDLLKKDSQGNVIEDHRGDFLVRNATPGIARNAKGLADAAMGKTTAQGNRRTVGQALGRMVGLKVNTIDAEEAAGFTAQKARMDAQEYARQVRRRRRAAERARANGDEGTAQALEAEAEAILQQRAAVMDSAADTLRKMHHQPEEASE